MARKSNITGVTGSEFSIGDILLRDTKAGLVLEVPNQTPVTLGEFSELGFSVRYSDETAPPDTPQEGDSYIVASGGTGAWDGRDNNIARWMGSSWLFYTPEEGWRVWDEEQDKTLVWTGSEWLHEIAQNVLTEVLANDGPGSGLNADLLDDLESTQFLRSDESGSLSGSLSAINFISPIFSNTGDININSTGNISVNIDTDNNNTGETFTITSNGGSAFLSASPTAFTYNGNGVVTDTRQVLAGAGLAGGGDLSDDRYIDVTFAGLGTGTALTGSSIVAFWDGSLRARTLNDLITDLNIVTSDNPLAVDAGTLDGLDSTDFARSNLTLTAGTGLSGGGNLTSSRTFAITTTGISSGTPAGINEIVYWTDANTPRTVSLSDFISDLNIAVLDSSGTFGATTFSGDITLEDGVDFILEGTSILGKSSQPWSSSNITSLFVGDGSEGNPSIAFISDTDTGIYRPTDNTLAISVGGGKSLEISSNGIIVKGNLTVEGTTVQVDSNTVNIGDNIIVLNSDEDGTPSQDAGFEVERGTSGNVRFIWNETDDRFSTVTSPLHVGSNLIVDGSATITGNVNGRDLTADGSKLDGIESNATADMAASEILTAIKTVDGSGSGLDANTLEGVDLSGIVQTSRSIATDIGLSGGGDLTSNLTLSLDFSDLIPTTVVDVNDSIIFSDNSASNLPKQRSFISLISDLGILRTSNTGPGNGLDADTIDGIQGASLVQNSITINTNNNSGLGGGGTLENSLNLYLDLNNIEVEQTTSADFIIFSDTSDGNDAKRRLIDDFITDLGVITTSDTGPGNGLDADTIDGLEGSQLLVTNSDRTYTGILTSSVSGGLRFSATGHSGWRTYGHTDGSLVFSINGTGGDELSLHANGVASSTAELRVNGNKVFHSGNDGSGSGLDADRLDGLDGLSYARSARNISTPTGSGLTGGGNLLTDRTLTLTNSDITTATVSGSDETTFFKSNALRKTDFTTLISDLELAQLNVASQTFSGDITVTGNLSVQGTTTTVNTTELAIADNIITLNSDVTGTPTETAGVEVERGTATNARIVWDEVTDTWQVGIVGSEYEILTTNSTINASTLSNISAGSFLRSDVDDEITGILTSTTSTTDANILVSNGSNNYEISAYSGELRVGVVGEPQLRYNGSEWQIGTTAAWYDVLHKGNTGSGSGIDADLLDGLDSTAFVQTTREITTDSGSGLYGGGDLSANRSLRLGTIGIPSTTAATSGNILFFTDSATVRQRSISNFITDNSIWTADNDGAGSGLNADLLDGVHLSGIVQTDRSISAGIGLSGGGDLTQNRTISLDIGSLSAIVSSELNDSLAFYDVSDNTVRRQTIANFITEFGLLRTSDEGSGNGIDADTVDGIEGTDIALNSTSINSGNGISGGGDLSSDRTLSLDLASLSSIESITNSDSLIFYDIDNNTAARRSVPNFITDLQLWTANNDGAGSGLNADLLDGIEASNFVQTTRRLNTSNGISGGGPLSSDLTLSIDLSNLGSTTITGSDNVVFQDVSANDITRTTTVDNFISSMGIARKNVDETFTGNIVIGGNLTVNGSTTTINTTELAVEDPEITLAKNQTGTPTLNSGIRIERGDEPDALIQWDETVNGWLFGIENNMKLLFVPGSGEVTDADTLDGLDSTAFVQTTRQLSTSLGISGGGDLSQNRSLSLSNAGLQVASIATADEIIFFDADDTSLPKRRNMAEVISDLSILTTSNEGSGNGIDADTVDSLEASQFLRSDADDTATGVITIGRNQSGLDDPSLIIDSSSNFSSIRMDAGDYSSAFGVSRNAWRHAFGNSDLSTIWWGYDGSNLKVQTGGVQVVNGNDIVSLGSDGNILLSRGSSGNPSGYIDFRGDTAGSFDQRIQASNDGLDFWDSTENYASINNTGIVLGSGTAVADGLYINNNNTDTNVWRIDDGSGNYGYYQKYVGSGAGNKNSLELWSDNLDGTDVLVNSIVQDGRVQNRTAQYNFGKEVNFEWDEYRSQTNVDFRIKSKSTNSLGSTNSLIIERSDELISNPNNALETLFSSVDTDGTGTLTGSITDPKGTSTSATLEKTSGTYYKRVFDTNVTAVADTVYDSSILAKVVSGQKFALQVWAGNQDNNFEVLFDTVALTGTDISSGNVTADTWSIVELEDDWYLCSVIATTDSSPTGNISLRLATYSAHTPEAVVSFAYPSIKLNERKTAANFYADGQTVLPGRIKLGGEARPVSLTTDFDTVIIGDTTDTDVGLTIYSTATGGIAFTDDGTVKSDISFDHATDILNISVGAGSFELLSTELRSGTSGGPSLRNTTASNINPSVIPSKGDTNTGIGWAGADQLSLIAGGTEAARITASSFTINDPVTINGGNNLYVTSIQGNGGGDLTLQPNGGDILVGSNTKLDFRVNNADYDFLRVGEDEDGEYGYFFRYTGSEAGVDHSLELWSENQVSTDLRVFRVEQDGVVYFDNIVQNTGTSWLLADVTPNATTPSLVPNSTDTNTGIGWNSADTLSLIAGGAEIVDINSNGVVSIKNSAGTWGRISTKHIDALPSGNIVLGGYEGNNVTVGSASNSSIRLLSSSIEPRNTSDSSYLGTNSSPFDKLVLSAGSNTAPSLTFGGDSNTGIYASASDEISITLGGSQIARFNGDDLYLTGTLYAYDKSFLIDHPTLPGKKLRHGSLEGPENGIYVRGRVPENGIIELPDYWEHIVDEESISVNLTPIGSHQKLYVEDIDNKKVSIKRSSWGGTAIKAFYIIYGERTDSKKLETVIDSNN